MEEHNECGSDTIIEFEEKQTNSTSHFINHSIHI